MLNAECLATFLCSGFVNIHSCPREMTATTDRQRLVTTAEHCNAIAMFESTKKHEQYSKKYDVGPTL